jgi:hypothetical protein
MALRILKTKKGRTEKKEVKNKSNEKSKDSHFWGRKGKAESNPGLGTETRT